MKQVFTKLVRYAMLAFCALMALPSVAENSYDGSKFYYVYVGNFDFFESSATFKYWNGSSDGQDPKYVATNLYTVKAASSSVSSITLKRCASDGTQWNYANVSAPSSEQNYINLTGYGNDGAMNYEWKTVTDKWEVMVASSGSTSYTSYSVTDYVSEEFTINEGDHFYLKHTVNTIEVDNCKSGTTMSLNTTSSSAISYLENTSHSTDNDVSWTGKTSKIKVQFSYSGENPYSIYCTGSEVASAPSAPTFTQDADANTETISCSTSDATIYYTTDGSTPSASSNAYSAPIAIPEGGLTLKAVAVKDGLSSDIISETFSYTKHFQVVKTYYIDGSGCEYYYNDGAVPQVSGDAMNSETDATLVQGSVYCFKVDKEAATVVIKRHTSSWSGNEITVSAAEDSDNDLILITGSTANTITYSWSKYEAPQVATPEISFNADSNVATITAVEGATLYYKKGSEESYTAADGNSATITFTEGMENVAISAYATKANYKDSEVATATYSYVKEGDPVSFYVQNDGGWNVVNLWAWNKSDSGSTNVFDSWPGSDLLNFNASSVVHYSCAVEKGHIGYDEVYKVTVAAKVNYIILSKGGADDYKSIDIEQTTFAGKLFKTSTKSFEDLEGAWESGEPTELVSTPTFTTHSTTNLVEIACATEGASIYYTLDGSDPTNEVSDKCFLYSEAFYITKGVTEVRAKGYKDGADASEVAKLEVSYKAEFDVNKTYYIQVDKAQYWKDNSTSVPLIYGCMNGEYATPILAGKYYSFQPTVEHQTMAYIQRHIGTWNSGEEKQVKIAASEDESLNMIVFDESKGEASSATWSVFSYVPEKWEVMVYNSSSEKYEEQEVTLSNSVYSTDYFTMPKNGHFYLKHTFEGGAVTNHGSIKSDDSYTRVEMSKSNDSKSVISYFAALSEDPSNDNDILWKGEIARVKIHFKYTNENPYNIYVSTSSVLSDDGGYYLVGDVNKWFNDGTYESKETGKNISYGYDAVKYGIKDDYKFEACDAAPSTAKRDDSGLTEEQNKNWYKLAMPKTSSYNNNTLDGRLFGQFTIYKGDFDEAFNDNGDLYYTVAWKNFTQWSWTEDKQKEVYDDYTKGLDVNELTDVVTTANKNVMLAHNYFKNATLYFNPEANKILLEVEAESDVKDLRVYYSRIIYKEESDVAKVKTPVLKINAASLNSNNYTINTALSEGEMARYDGTKEMDGVTYNIVWYKRIVPGMENPAGQKITVSIDADDYVSTSEWVAIKNQSVYLTDYIHLFLDTDNMVYQGYNLDVNKVEARVYGWSEDGSEIQVCGSDGVFFSDSATGNECWVELNRGTYDTSAISTDKMKTEMDFSSAWEDSDSGKVWSTYSNESNKFMQVNPINARKYVQYRITGKLGAKSGSSSAPRREASATETTGSTVTYCVPDYFETDRPDEDLSASELLALQQTGEYTYVLTGQTTLISLGGIETGIEEIMDEDAQEAVEGVEVETIYYNLQGQRVKNPERGIYIRVHGNKASKVML